LQGFFNALISRGEKAQIDIQGVFQEKAEVMGPCSRVSKQSMKYSSSQTFFDFHQSDVDEQNDFDEYSDDDDEYSETDDGEYSKADDHYHLLLFDDNFKI
jgi:hypothetical protein